MNTPDFTIELDEMTGLGLVIACKSRVTYTNQVGGYACRHPELEGVFVPLPGNGAEKLNEYFIGPKWNGRCYDSIDEETASFIDSVLRELDLGSSLCVDREKLEESCEAWIWVKISMNSLLWLGLNEGEGILTWENSD
jgi:hypothetical protein